jgi:nucleoside-diphosphate-sugar epimerase
MKRVLLTGINGTVAQVMKEQLDKQYDISGISIARMDDVLTETRPSSWKEQLDTYRDRVTEQLTTACAGVDAIVHLGWNTRDENWQGGLDPLNILVVDCVYRVAIATKVGRIYLASSVHAYDFMGAGFDPAVSISPFPDTRQDPFGTPPSSLYGVSKRWMEIAGQFYAQRLSKEQKILLVRLGAVSRKDLPRRMGRLWASHRDCAGLLQAFIESEEAPDFSIAFGVSNNLDDQHAEPLFDAVNHYGFVPADNAQDPGKDAAGDDKA